MSSGYKKRQRLSTNVRLRLSQLREKMYDADEFIDAIVQSSFGATEQDEPTRQERLKFLNALQQESVKQLKKTDSLVRFDRLDENPSGGRTLFELIQQIAEHKLKRKGATVKFPDWLLESLERVTNEVPNDQSESTSYDDDKVPASPRRNNTPQRDLPQEVYENGAVPVFDESKIGTPRSTPRRSDSSPRREGRSDSTPRREGRSDSSPRREGRSDSSPRREEPKQADEGDMDELDSFFANRAMEVGTPSRLAAGGRVSQRRSSSPKSSPRVSPTRRSSSPKKSPASSPRVSPARSSSPTISPRVSPRGSPKNSQTRRPSVGGASPRTQAGARTPLELTQAQRVALHFMTPGDASRQTLIEFVDLVKPLSTAGADNGLVYDPDGPVGDIRNYAYELWLNQKDDQLLALAEDISGGNGDIHPTIETELNDAVGRYTRQLADIKRNGALVLENIKTQAQRLKGKSKENFLKCADDVEAVLDPGSKKTQCTEIHPDDKLDGKLGPSKWLAINTPNLDGKDVKFLMDLSPRQIEEFAEYVISQSAIGTCRMSKYLQAIADTLESEFQVAKQSSDNALTFTTDKLETLRFLEWVMRRPGSPRTKDSTARWLFKYPYLQGTHHGSFRRQQKAQPFELASKYQSFMPRSNNDQTLAQLFRVTEKENLFVLKMATEGDSF